MSISTENFLKNVYLLAEEEGVDAVTSGALARRLNVSPAAVSDMAGRLERKGLIEHQPYRSFHLLPRGRVMAIDIVRKHRIWELFLYEVLEMDLLSIHQEAEKLEHHTSDELAEKMFHYLGNPLFDPHGDPIPDAQGDIPSGEALSTLETQMPGTVCTVKQLRYRDRETSEMYERHGIRQEMDLFIRKIYDFDGSVEVETRDGRDIVIGRKLASLIYCLSGR
ncbi:MAG: metal-dependent transcriptional regulator [Bacteroidota bacterium]